MDDPDVESQSSETLAKPAIVAKGDSADTLNAELNSGRNAEKHISKKSPKQARKILRPRASDERSAHQEIAAPGGSTFFGSGARV